MAESTLSLTLLRAHQIIREKLGLSQPYSTGTITIASGVVTLSGTGAAWPANAANSDLFHNGSLYRILTRNSTLQVTIQNTGVTDATPRAFISGENLAATHRVIERGLRRFVNPVALDGDSPHQWRFLRPVHYLTTSPPYSTGTITVVSGAVTGSGTTFPSTSANGWELVAGGGVYEVATYASGTSITLVDTSVNLAAGTAYTLVRPGYDLPDNWGDLIGKLHYKPNQSILLRMIESASWGEIQNHRALYDPGYVFYPRRCCVIPKNFAIATGTRYRLYLDPAPDAAYQLVMRYAVRLDMPTNPTDYFPGSAEHSETLIAACLAVLESSADKERGVEHAEYVDRLRTSIALDRMTGPDTVGVMTDPMNEVPLSLDGMRWHYPTSANVTLFP